MLQANVSSTSTTTDSDTATYTLNFTDTVSSSWNDVGVEDTTSNDSVVGETDTYTWEDVHSPQYGVTGTVHGAGEGATSSEAYVGNVFESFSTTDAGCDTLALDESDSELTLAGGNAVYTYYDTITYSVVADYGGCLIRMSIILAVDR